MNKLFSIAVSSLMIVLCAACGKEKFNPSQDSFYVQTDSCKVMEYFGVNVFGTLLLDEYETQNLDAGFSLSTNSSFSGAEPVQWQNLYQGSFMSVIFGLKPETKYYYRAFVFAKGRYRYGKTLTFTTEAIPQYHVFEVQVTPNTAELYVGVAGKSFINLTAKVFPEEAVDNSGVRWKSSDPSVATVNDGLVSAVSPGTAVITATAGDGQYSDKCVVIVKKPVPAGAVDMGLSVYWSQNNLGTSSQLEAGYLYAWGETVGKQTFPAGTYKYFNDDGEPTKYTGRFGHRGGTADNLVALLPEDDAASVALKGTWRIPSWNDFAELLGNCTLSVYPKDDPAGVKFTSKKNGNAIVIPFNTFIDGVNESTQANRIYLWTNEVEEYYNESYKAYVYYNAYAFTVDVIGGKTIVTDRVYFKRNVGVRIRPVCN